MSPLSHFLADRWLGLLLLNFSLLLFLRVALRRWRRKTWSASSTLAATAFALLAAGGLALNPNQGSWVTLAALTGLFVALMVLLGTGGWSAPLAWALVGLLLFGLGGFATITVGAALRRTANVLLAVEFLQPAWLVLLATLPLLFLIARRSLGFANLDQTERAQLSAILRRFLLPPWGMVGLVRFLRQRSARVPGLARRWVSFGLRCCLIALLSLALAEPRLAVPYENTTVLFVLDRSLSVPEETGEDGLTDQRWLRVRRFLNEAVKFRPTGHERDQAGLIVFGRRPRLELLPGEAPRFNLTEITSPIDGHATDIAAALQLALATFPEGKSRRIVLISDGNENRGNAAEVAALARLNGVQIDVLPLAAGHRNENEVLVERVAAPALTEQGAQLPLKVWVRSYSQRPIAGTLVVRQVSESRTRLVEEPPPRVTLRLGLNSFSFKQPLGAEQESYTYEAEFIPEGILDERGRLVVRGLKGDRVQNNRAATHVVARGRRRVLLLESQAGQHRELVDRLRAAGQSRFRVEARTVAFLDRYQDSERLAAYLSNFDCVILANIPADMVTEEQQEVLRANTHDQGCGLVAIGGPQSYGAGGWQNTAIEKALPVDADIKATEFEDKNGLVLVMHASEMAEGNHWQKKIAKLAIERLGSRDEVGVLHYDWNVRWHIPLQEVGQQRGALMRQIDRLEPGDMPDFDPALRMAREALTETKRRLAARRVIVISDGDPQQNDRGLLGSMRRDGIVVSTVGVATHGPPQNQLLQRMADATRGQAYFPKRPSELPAIYLRETRMVSRSFLHEDPFQPVVKFRSGPTAGLQRDVPKLNGFVRTTLKPGPLVEAPIKSPPFAGLDYPILAYWPYGLGKAVAFTSDAGRPKLWSAGWANSPLYAKFWEQVVEWSLRPIEGRNLTMTSDHRDGGIRVVVEARTESGEPDLYLRNVRAEVTPPRVGRDARKPQVKFEQKSAGLYEATFPAEEAGSYFIAFQAVRRVMREGKEVEQRESVRGSVTVPYAPEFADMESNPDLLDRLRQETGGERYADQAQELARVARAGTVFRPGPPGYAGLHGIWYWLVVAVAVLLLFDVAVRRIALERLEVAGPLLRLWMRLRRRAVETQAGPQFLDRLQSRKAQVSEALARERAVHKFEASETPALAPPGATETTPAAPLPRPPAPSPPAAPPPETEAGDYGSRLLRAKKRVWQERPQDEGPEKQDKA